MTAQPAAQFTVVSSDPAPARSPASAHALNDCPEGTAVIVTLPTEIDISNDAQVRDMLADALARRPAVVIADGTQTTFCSSSGVSTLLEAHHGAAVAGAQLRLVAPAAQVRRILELTGAGSQLCVCSSLEAAAQANGMDLPSEARARSARMRLNPGRRPVS
jgi:anti-sigma B factor antagonist